MEWSSRIGRRIRLRDLHILLAVAQNGSMSKAARELAVSHPVIVKVVADLERTLGVRLLDRDRHGAEPTVYGRALLKHGLAAFEELRQGVKAIEFLSDPTAGELRLGGPDPMIAGLIPAVINRLSRQYPRLVFQVTMISPGLGQYRALREREIELFIGRAPPAEDDLHIEVLFDEPPLVAAGKQNRWLRRRQIELSELIDEPWVLPTPDSLPGALVAELFQSAGLGLPARAVICGSLQMNDALLATGRYLAVYPGSVLRLGGVSRSVRVLPVKLPALSRPVGILTLKNRMISPTAQLFVDCAREITKSWMLRTPPRTRRPQPLEAGPLNRP
jgi:DNA-binding transcriptional LysR family regulator